MKRWAINFQQTLLANSIVHNYMGPFVYLQRELRNLYFRVNINYEILSVIIVYILLLRMYNA